MLRPLRVAASLGASAWLAGHTELVQAHGIAGGAPTLSRILSSWSAEALPWIGVLTATVAYLVAVRLVNRSHVTPVPRWRVAAWLAGMATIGIALLSAVDSYSTDLLSVHMVQHLILAMVAPPLLAIGAPITLLLRVSAPGIRRSVILPILHSRAIQAIAWPPVGWVAFAAVMWITHFSPLFNAALEDPGLHTIEHLLYLGAGVLFWWPVIGADPGPWRLRPIPRMAYLAAQMPFNTAVGLAIYFASSVLYPHYATRIRLWGPDPFTDQQIAGILMWGAGDVILLGALVLAAAAWLRAEEEHSRRIEARGARNVDRGPVESP